MANIKISDLVVGLELLSDSETFLTDLNKDPASLIYGGGAPCGGGSKSKSQSKGHKSSKSKNGCVPMPMPCVPMPMPCVEIPRPCY